MLMALYGNKMNAGGRKSALACSCKVCAAKSSSIICFSLFSVITPAANPCIEGLRYESFLAAFYGVEAVGNVNLLEKERRNK